jgi:predicted O-linked N-acetylglucosamine transferase (SPINDLY family)
MSAVQLIRNDKIDILIDCAGHMMGNRLGIFAVRGAPVQVSGIGYPNTTGLKTIDYRITDAIADPLGETVCHTEKLLRIPDGFCCFRPPVNAPDVSEAPFKENGFITFGSLHTPARLNRQVISLWARILLTIKNSRLVIFRTTLSLSVISRLRSWFCEYEIDMSRIDFCTTIPDAGYLSVYSSIDVLFDTFPWSGHTTACEALWMGVPVLTLRGDRHAGRMVSSVLSRMGLLDLIAADEDEYVRISEFLAVNPERLVDLRSSLRFTMKNSSLCDGVGYTRSFEKCLQEILRVMGEGRAVPVVV